MVRIQLATAMRPSELFRMRPCDIARSEEVWFHRPVIKRRRITAKKKSVPNLGDALESLAPSLFGDAEESYFQNSNDTTWNKNNDSRHIARACKKVGVRWTAYELRHRALQTVHDVAERETSQTLMHRFRLCLAQSHWRNLKPSTGAG